MQGLILGAGLGSRLGNYTKDYNKCMLEINGKKLIQRQIEALKSVGIDKIIIVCGYKMQELKDYINKTFSNDNIIFVENNKYKTTNNIYSLYLARKYLSEDDTILLEADLIFDYSIIQKLVNSNEQNIVAVSKYNIGMDGTVVTADENGDINHIYGKDEICLNNEKKYYKTINIYKLSKQFCKDIYVPSLEEYIKIGKVNEYYESVFKKLINISKLHIKVFDKEKWYEIDNVQDLDIAECLFTNDLNKYQKRYGGYWRFNNMKDFCYLENPTFPPKKMMEEISYFSKELITKYPSGIEIQNFNAARLFNVDKDKIIVGNGAAELIKVLGDLLTGKLLIQVPVFNEYIRCFKNCEIIKSDTSKNDYYYGKKEIIKNINNVDTIVIVNPDNPSGNYINFEDMQEILEEAHKNSTKVIVDESFMDFADKEKRYTLIDDEIVNKYNNLIVVKSISKSYGVPGIRLGVLATGNKALIKQIKSNLGIWNINSVAEYFLQIISLYKEEFESSCEYIASQRRLMYKELSKIKYLKVYNSQANYFMCKLINVDSTEFSQILLNDYSILIKDLKGKEGFEENYIRIAIKKEEDNILLIRAINEIFECKINNKNNVINNIVDAIDKISILKEENIKYTQNKIEDKI